MKLERYITPEYLASQKWLHNRPKGYGGGGDNWAPAVGNIAWDNECKSILDYGCGQGKLGEKIKSLFPSIEFVDYDPAIEGKDSIEKYKTFDMVVCTDVLEHIEPNRLAVVINHLFKLTNKVLFLVIATRPSNKFFQDGRNVHLTIEPASWWVERLQHPLFMAIDPPSSPHTQIARELVLVMKKLPC